MLGGAPGDRHVTDWVLAGDLRVGQTVAWCPDEPRVIRSIDERNGYIVLAYDGSDWESHLLPHIFVPVASSVAEAAA